MKHGIVKNDKKEFWFEGDFLTCFEFNSDHDIRILPLGTTNCLYEGNTYDCLMKGEDFLKMLSEKALNLSTNCQFRYAYAYLWEKISLMPRDGLKDFYKEFEQFTNCLKGWNFLGEF